MPELTPLQRRSHERVFVWRLAIVATLAAFLPALFAIIHTPPGSSYLGFEYNTDDHMVYAAWMRQAMAGHFLFDNRFTTDTQPGLTIHLYFFVLGLLAKVVGIPWAAALGRAVFSVLFVFLAFRLIHKLNFTVYGVKLALTVVVVGGGLGFLLWQNFDITITKPVPEIVSAFLAGGLPTDVWQPEGFVFPSMLTNGLFMVSLCLILYIFSCFLECQTSQKAVLGGFLAMGLLMNIHSYDALTIALVMVGLLAAVLSRRQANVPWVGRAMLIGLGAVVPALWFVHVLQSDPVFQARAKTDTYSPDFRQVLVGYLPLVVCGLVAAFIRAKQEPDKQTLRLSGWGLVVLLLLGLTVAAGHHPAGFFLSPPVWGLVFVAAVAGVGLMADADPAWNLVLSWAVIGAVAIYFPGLFQRKLTMGLSIPWAILSAYAVDSMTAKTERSSRNLATALALLIVGASSVRWLFRDMQYIVMDVSSTTRHPVYLNPDERRVLEILNNLSGRHVVLAFPGASGQSFDSDGKPIPDTRQIVIPDLSPILSGLAGVYTYAGHWSETPDYGPKAGEVSRFFLSRNGQPLMSPDERKAFLTKSGADFAVVPQVTDFGAGRATLAPDSLGQVVYSGSQLSLVKLNQG